MRPLETFVACPHSCIVADHVEQMRRHPRSSTQTAHRSSQFKLTPN